MLLEYLVKNGSERVIDDARSHVSLIKVLRNFYYIDEKGKDEGINSKVLPIMTFMQMINFSIMPQFAIEPKKLLGC